MNKKISVALVVATAVLSGGSFVFARGMGSGGVRSPIQLQETASVLGVTTDGLIAELNAGKTIQEVAKEKGISETKLQETFHTQMMLGQKARFAQLVRNGKITQVQADAQLQWMSDHAKWINDHPAPLWGSKGMMGVGKGRMGMHGWGRF